jgi:hypothetical protein
LCGILKINPSDRLTANEIQLHDWFQNKSVICDRDMSKDSEELLFHRCSTIPSSSSVSSYACHDVSSLVQFQLQRKKFVEEYHTMNSIMSSLCLNGRFYQGLQDRLKDLKDEENQQQYFNSRKGFPVSFPSSFLNESSSHTNTPIRNLSLSSDTSSSTSVLTDCLY